jgi:uncharacterized protein YndB with AHSA1/START domain
MKAVETVVIAAGREDVFEVLCDAASYPEWVVGTNRLRDADPDWPAVGSRFHHAVGFRPFELRDSTQVRNVEAPSWVELHVKVRPLFEAIVDLRLEALGAESTRVIMTEHAVGGLAVLAGPLNVPALSIRNRLALRRLARIAEGRRR